MPIQKINLQQAYSTFSETWSPRIIGRLNGQLVKIARVDGDFIWHDHPNEDEGFWVIDGTLFIELKDQMLELTEGEFVVIPRGVRHRPFTKAEAKIMLFEPESTVNTGNEESDRTKRDLKDLS